MNKFLIVLIFLSLVFPRELHANVVINEFSSSTGPDWIELFSSEDVDLNGWKLDDENTQTFLKEFDVGDEIGPSTSRYLVVEVGDRLNGDGDTITLYKPDDSTQDEISYGGEGEVCLPGSGGSIARIPDGSTLYDRLLAHTKGVINGDIVTDPCPTPTPIPTSTFTPTPTPEPTSTPTSTPDPTSTTTTTSTPTPTDRLTTDTPTPEDSSNNGNDDDTVLALREDLTITPTPKIDEGGRKKLPLGAIFLILVGLGFISASVYPLLKGKIKIGSKRKIFNEKIKQIR